MVRKKVKSIMTMRELAADRIVRVKEFNEEYPDYTMDYKRTEKMFDGLFEAYEGTDTELELDKCWRMFKIVSTFNKEFIKLSTEENLYKAVQLLFAGDKKFSPRYIKGAILDVRKNILGKGKFETLKTIAKYTHYCRGERVYELLQEIEKHEQVEEEVDKLNVAFYFDSEKRDH